MNLGLADAAVEVPPTCLANGNQTRTGELARQARCRTEDRRYSFHADAVNLDDKSVEFTGRTDTVARIKGKKTSGVFTNFQAALKLPTVRVASRGSCLQSTCVVPAGCARSVTMAWPSSTRFT